MLVRLFRRLTTLLAAVLLLAPVGAASATGAHSTPVARCSAPTRLLTVAAGTGHLLELAYCPADRAFLPARVIDRGAWNGYRAVFATGDRFGTLVYAMSKDGRLWLRRQARPGGPLGRPERVAAAVDWSRFDSVVAPSPGYLLASEDWKTIRTFRHRIRPGGRVVLTELPPLRSGPITPPLSALNPGGFGESILGKVHLRFWTPDTPEHDAAYTSGVLPEGLLSVAGEEPTLFGVDAAGRLIALEQTPPADWTCLRRIVAPWESVATAATGTYDLVIVPTRASPGPPRLAPLPSEEGCPTISGAPWDWS